MFLPEDHVVDQVDAYLHGALEYDDARYVERHCESCRVCQVALEEARERAAALRALPPVEAPERLLAATERRIGAAPRFQMTPTLAGLAMAAATVLLLTGVTVYYATLSPSPYDLRVLGQRVWLTGSEPAVRVVMIDRRAGRPIADVPVRITLAKGPGEEVAELATFDTDRFGTGHARLRLPDWEEGEYCLRVEARPARKWEVVERPVELRRSWQVMLTSDKPVYQPGQTIHVRSLSLARPDLKPVAGQRAEYSVTDPKGNVIFRKRGVTSRFGIASVDCPLATEMITGPYEVACRIGDTTQRITVEVKEYVLPKFRVEVTLDEPFYSPGDLVRGSVQANYFFGKPVAGSEVRLDAQTIDVENRSFHRSTITTDAEGSADFEFRLPEMLVGRPQHDGDAALRLEVTVRDAAGQEHATHVDRMVSSEPIRIEVIPEAGTLVPGVPNTVYMLTTYLDGRPAETRVLVSGLRRELTTNSLGVARFEVEPDGPVAQWTVRATDAEGRTVSREVRLPVGTTSGDFLVRTDKAVYDGGETARIQVLGGGSEPVFLDLIKDGQTMLTQSIEMRDGQGLYEMDLPPELFGTIELYAYRFNQSGFAVGKRRVVYVEQAGRLRVETKFDRETYRPGEQARLAFQLTDHEGNPAPGAISLAAVDEAVFSVLAQRPGMEQTFFTLDSKLLEPVYAVYPWSPDALTDAARGDRTLLHQALFSHAAAAGDDRMEVLREMVARYADDDQRLLNVLNRPDLDELIEHIWLPDELKPLLRGEDGIHSLSVSTFPEKMRQVEQTRRKGLKTVKGVWIALGVLVVVATLLIIARSLPGILVLLVIGGTLMALLLPAVQSAREASRRVSALNDLKQLGMAAENYRDEHGKIDASSGSEADDAKPARVRQWFPETLLWRPELITDDDGRASLEVDLADSITTWRLSLAAVSAGGELGGATEAITVFQPFFVDMDLPVALTRGDEVAVPVVVYNYLDAPQRVELKLSDADWFEPLDPSQKSIDLEPEEVRQVSFRIRAGRVGRHELLVHAQGQPLSVKKDLKDATDDSPDEVSEENEAISSESVADTVRRTIEVEPEGRRVERVFSGTLRQPAEMELDVPPDAVEGSAGLIVKVYPSSVSQLVEGLEGIFQRPYGCFEQTSSTTYPNILALDYLRRTDQSVPAVEATARQYIHLGYQKLLTFEVAGGGFDWFGNPPANQTLTAYGLMEFEDMARVHDVDPVLIARTRRWLMERRRPDGSWAPEANMLNDGLAGSVYRDGEATLAATAYIAWAALSEGRAAGDSRPTLQYLLQHEPASIESPYTLALVAAALMGMDASGRTAREYLDRLDAMKRQSADGKLVWWEQPDAGRTIFHGGGRAANIEATALATLAMLQSGGYPGATGRALAWLIEQKDPQGTWYSTQATVLALKALLAGTGKPLGGEQLRRVEVVLDGKLSQEISIPAEQSDVVRQVNLTPLLTGSDTQRLTLTEHSDTAAGYQVVLSYHVPDEKPVAGQLEDQQRPLSITVEYDRIRLTVDQTVTATATVTNHLPAVAPMVIVDLPIPPGFSVVTDDLRQMVAADQIARFEVTARSVIVYLRELPAKKPLVLRYGLRATMPVKVTAEPARVYEYYDPDTVVMTGPVGFVVEATP